jgi:protein phosphatase
LVVQTLHDQYYGDLTCDIDTALAQSIRGANAAVYQRAAENPELRGMGSTCTALVIWGRQVHIAHVGDTRAYLVRDGGIRQLTEDHSKVAQLVRDGLLTEEEAENHPERNVILRSLGPKSEVAVAVYRPFETLNGDIFVMCSDGLTGYVSAEEVLQVAESRTPDVAAERYIEMANARGGADNTTVHVVQVGDRVARSRGSRVPPTMVDGTAMPGKASGSSKKWLLYVGLMIVVACLGAAVGWTATVFFGNGAPQDGAQTPASTPDGGNEAKKDPPVKSEERQGERTRGRSKSTARKEHRGKQIKGETKPGDRRTGVDAQLGHGDVLRSDEDFSQRWSVGSANHRKAMVHIRPREEKHYCDKLRRRVAAYFRRPPMTEWEKLVPLIADFQYDKSLKVDGTPGRMTLGVMFRLDGERVRSNNCDLME